jgi:ParB family chromosome partitioning protein
MAEIIASITDLPVDDIDMGQRLRPVSSAGVAALKTSILELGVIKDAIHVRKLKKGGKIVLLAGGHRLTAARELRDEGRDGFGTVKVVCWSCTDEFARLMEIDDNLAGAELSALDTAVFLAERKRVYEKMHPETRAAIGAELVAKRWNSVETVSVASFAEAIAQQMGITPRHVRNFVRAGERLDSRDVSDLREAVKPVGVADLMTLSKITQPTDRYDVVKLLKAGEAKNAASAWATVKAANGQGKAPKSPVDAAHMRMVDNWKRAPKAAKVRYLEDCGDEIIALLKEMGDL